MQRFRLRVTQACFKDSLARATNAQDTESGERMNLRHEKPDVFIHSDSESGKHMACASLGAYIFIAF